MSGFILERFLQFYQSNRILLLSSLTLCVAVAIVAPPPPPHPSSRHRICLLAEADWLAPLSISSVSMPAKIADVIVITGRIKASLMQTHSAVRPASLPVPEQPVS